jgi:Fic family protein
LSAQLALTFTAPDRVRLGKQLVKVRDFLLANAGTWLTLREISDATGAPEASASARLRDLARLGLPHELKRAAPGSGTWLYRVTG